MVGSGLMATWQPYTVEGFGGLDLAHDPEEVGASGAIDLLNADVDQRGRVRSRGGLVAIGTGTASYQRVIGLTGTKLVVARNTGSGLVFQTVTVSSGSFGTASTAYGSSSTAVTSYVVSIDAANICARSGSTNETLRVDDGTTVSASTSAPRYVALTPIEERFALAHFTSDAGTPSGSNGSVSTVWFSDPRIGTFDSTNWVTLNEGDGDEITGMVIWRELLFVIKRSALYIFYSTSIDSTGGAIFNFRRVDLPVRARATTNRGGENIVAGGDGVYLLLGDGLYRTTGGPPVRVSDAVTPLFDGTGASSMRFPDSGDWSIGYAANRVYLSYQAPSTAYRTLVYDTQLGVWLLWDLTVGASALPANVIEWRDDDGLPVSYVAAGAKVYSLSRSATDDAGTAISWSWQSGWYTMGQPQEKFIAHSWLVGSGSPTLDIFTDYGTSDPLSRGASVTLGNAPVEARGLHTPAYQGRFFSHKFSGSSASTISQFGTNIIGMRDR